MYDGGISGYYRSYRHYILDLVNSHYLTKMTIQ